ncbi:MAG: hypothetical protein HYZ37_16605 [Candidatus Solibacter usitatus]|nr:hypothetical protein [Candidatus Solibacter usitatus]
MRRFSSMKLTSSLFSRRMLLRNAFVPFALMPASLPAAGKDFWNKKEPSEWTGAEIHELTTKSPWAKEVTAKGGPAGGGGAPRGGGGNPRGGGGMGGGKRGGVGIGMGGIGIGGGGIGMGTGGRGRGMGGMGGGRAPASGGGGRGGAGASTKMIVRWESAAPVAAALHSKLPEEFANHYVIGVDNVPLSRLRGYGGAENNEELADYLKGSAWLSLKAGTPAQPGVARIMKGSRTVLYGFSKETVSVSMDEKEASFHANVGPYEIKTKFVLQDMKYKGKLAV